MTLVLCPACSRQVSLAAPACPQCGHPIAAASYPVPRIVAAQLPGRGTAVFLALILGGLGAHKFYLGSPGLGILYLLFCWTFIPSIIGFFEGLGYLFTSDESWTAQFATRVR
ncbi:MAG: NINE protein [Gemmatimonadales bacterium]